MGCISGVLSLDPCCGTVKLRTATVFIACVEIILSTSAILIYILSLATLGMYKTQEALRNSKISTFLNFWDLAKEDQDIDEIKHRLWQVFGVCLLISVANLVISGILLYAARMRHIFLLRVWIVSKALGISLCVVYLLTTIFLSQATLVGGLLDVTEILIFCYFFFVCYAFMKELKEEQVLKMSPSIIQTQGKIEVSFPL